MIQKRVDELKVGEAFFFPHGRVRHRVEEIKKVMPTMRRVIANYGKAPNYRLTNKLLFNWEMVTVYE